MFMKDAMTVLSKLHEMNIAHCDIKPCRFLLTPSNSNFLRKFFA